MSTSNDKQGQKPYPGGLYRGSVVPYTTRWSTEDNLPVTVIERLSRPGIAFSGERITDRDPHGVLWQRVLSCPGVGRPEFGKVHPDRQRHAMRQLLCQICAGPADQNELGMLWLLPDYDGYHDDWAGWPELMATPEPPVCQPCAHTAIRLCPALGKGYIALRVRRPLLTGVRGTLYKPGPLVPKAVDEAMVTIDDPLIPWICAANLVRELTHCTIVQLDNDETDLTST
jgi:hypothetical protein